CYGCASEVSCRGLGQTAILSGHYCPQASPPGQRLPVREGRDPATLLWTERPTGSAPGLQCHGQRELELFLNKRGRSSKAPHRCPWHHPQNQLCDCGRHAPKCCSVSCRQWHAQSRSASDSRRYWPLFAHRSIVAEGSF